MADPLIVEILERIKDKSVVFFVGAGISRNEPSGIPLSAEFIRTIIDRITEKLDIVPSDDDLMQLTNIRLESFFSQLNSLLKGDIHKIINALRDTVPNQIHYFISALYRGGYIDTVLTTNFDYLLEVCAGNDYQVIHHPDDYLLPDNSSTLRIYKLHGSIDPDLERMKTSIKISLKDVNRPFQPEKIRVLRKIIENRHIVFLGYSGLDDFDIFPVLLKTNSQFKYYWINHAEKDAPVLINRNVQQILDKRPNSVVLNLQTINFIKTLATICQMDIPTLAANSHVDVKSRIRQAVGETILADAPNYIIGKLFSFARNTERSLEYYQYAIERKELTEDYILRDVGAVYIRSNDLDKAINIYKGCLKRCGPGPLAASNNINIGYAYLRKYEIAGRNSKHLTLAEGYLNRALGNSSINDADMSYAIHNLALVKTKKEEYGVALKLLEESIKIKIEIGEVNAEGRGLALKGEIYSLSKQNEEAICCFNESLRIHELVEDKMGIWSTLISMSEHYGRIGDTKNEAIYAIRAREYLTSGGPGL